MNIAGKDFLTIEEAAHIIHEWEGDMTELDELRAENRLLSEAMANATQEIERLREAHKRNASERINYNSRGHRCDWRVMAEGMIERSRRALENSDD